MRISLCSQAPSRRCTTYGRLPIQSTTSTRGPARGHSSSVNRRFESLCFTPRAGAREMTACRSPTWKNRASTCSSTPRNAVSTMGHSECTRSSCRRGVRTRGGRIGGGRAAAVCAFAARCSELPSLEAGGSLEVERTWNKPLRTDPIFVINAESSTARISMFHSNLAHHPLVWWRIVEAPTQELKVANGRLTARSFLSGRAAQETAMRRIRDDRRCAVERPATSAGKACVLSATPQVRTSLRSPPSWHASKVRLEIQGTGVHACAGVSLHCSNS